MGIQKVNVIEKTVVCVYFLKNVMKKSVTGRSKETPGKNDSGHRKRVMWKITPLAISVSQPVCQSKQKEWVLGKWYITAELLQLSETDFFPPYKQKYIQSEC